LINCFCFFRELYVERIEKKADALAQITRQADEKNVLSINQSVSKTTDDDLPPNDLLCPICKRVFIDAVITPCCSFSFCDDCKIDKNYFYLILLFI
jgi:hypothetical protein